MSGKVFSRVSVLAAAVVASLVLSGFYLAQGGGAYRPADVADPCETREWRSPVGVEAILDQVALSAADGAACELGVSREEFVVAMSSARARSSFVKRQNLTDDQVDDAVRSGLRRTVDDARDAGAIGDIENFLLQRAIDEAPIDFIFDRIGRP